MRSTVDDRLGKVIYADNIKLIKGRVKKTPESSVGKAGLQLLFVDRSELYSQLDKISSDQVITPLEKRILQREWNVLLSEKNSTLTKAGEYGLLDSEYVESLTDTFTSLSDLINLALDPLHMNEETDISEAGDLSAMFEDFYNAKALLDERIFLIENGRLNGIDLSSKIELKIINSTGSTVPQDGTPTALKAILLLEDEDITDDYLESDFEWSRITEDTESDFQWKGKTGKSITIDKDDLVGKQATFFCKFTYIYGNSLRYFKFGSLALSEEVPGEDAISVQIFSTNGNIFRDGKCYTVMRAFVWQGDEDITEQIDASNFTWERTSQNTISDLSWNTSSKAIGKKSITLTPDDVFGRTVFACHVDL